MPLVLPIRINVHENEITVNLKSASFVIIMHLLEGLTHIQSQIKPWLHFGESFTLITVLPLSPLSWLWKSPGHLNRKIRGVVLHGMLTSFVGSGISKRDRKKRGLCTMKKIVLPSDIWLLGNLTCACNLQLNIFHPSWNKILLLLEVPRSKYKHWGDRAFSVAAPRLSHKLPTSMHLISDLGLFKSRLKTYLFRMAFNTQ